MSRHKILGSPPKLLLNTVPQYEPITIYNLNVLKKHQIGSYMGLGPIFILIHSLSITHSRMKKEIVKRVTFGPFIKYWAEQFKILEIIKNIYILLENSNPPKKTKKKKKKKNSPHIF